jgi:hypothetical protein
VSGTTSPCNLKDFNNPQSPKTESPLGVPFPQGDTARIALHDFKLEGVRRAGMASLWYLTKRILGYDRLGVPHRRLCDSLQNLVQPICEARDATIGQRKKIILWPRKTYKTTCASIGLPIFVALHNRDVRVLLHSETLEGQSFKLTRVIKEHLEKNQRLRDCYGDLHGPKGARWTDAELTINRTKVGLKEGTFTAGAVGSVETGPHYDLIISDDPVSDENTGTREQVEKVIDDHRQLLAALSDGGVFVLIGTRWLFGDLYGWVTDSPEGWDKTEVLDCYHPDFYPKILTPEFLEEQRVALGPYRFSCWYLNNPIDPEKQVYQQTWFQSFDGPVPDGEKVWVTFDPALCEKRDSDLVGYAAISRRRQGPVHVLEARHARLNPLEFVNTIFDLHYRYSEVTDFQGIGIEEDSIGVTLMYFLREEMKRRDVYPKIIELPRRTGANAKDRAIREMAGRYAAHGVFHRCRECIELEDELIRFPSGKRVDVADALEMAIRLSVLYYGDARVIMPKRVTESELPGDFPKQEQEWLTI